jgi:hypothetical protein
MAEPKIEGASASLRVCGHLFTYYADTNGKRVLLGRLPEPVQMFRDRPKRKPQVDGGKTYA